jgi:hypothetical protein
MCPSGATCLPVDCCFSSTSTVKSIKNTDRDQAIILCKDTDRDQAIILCKNTDRDQAIILCKDTDRDQAIILCKNTAKNFYRSPFSKWLPQYRTNSTLSDFNDISYVGRL